MKKLLALLVFLLSIFTFIEVSHATVTLEKKVIVKNLILAKSELRKNVSNAESYITELDSFFEKYKDDSEKLEGILERVQSAKIKLGSSITHNTTRRILSYIEHLSVYTLSQGTGGYTPPTPNPPVEPNDYKATNTETLADMKLLESIINAKISGSLNIQDIVGEQIQETTSTGSYFLMGYPNYGNLGLLKDSYTDALGHELIITVLVSSEGEFYQILGYLQKDKDTKTAYVTGNYVKPNQYYPISLFVDPNTKAPIITGNDMDIE